MTTIDSALPIPTAAWRGRASPGAIGLAERGWVPDAVVRIGIRQLLRQRLRAEDAGGVEAAGERLRERFAAWRASPLAVGTADANDQHYEVPAGFYLAALGPRLKYSSCWYRTGSETLAEAEEAMLALTCARAGIADGQEILELGCGWGSLSLWMAERYPHARITAVSNSRSQRAFIIARAAERGLANLSVITADLRGFSIDQRFDRVVSVECFEHLRNHSELFRRIAGWLKPDGRLFVHVFVHRHAAYLFADEGDADWMTRHFFGGGMMPSDDLFLHCQDDLAIADHWRVSGRHYGQTAEHWLENVDRNRDAALAALATDGLDPAAARLQVNRWRIFFMACAELWNFRGGDEWFVSHYLFRPRAA